MKDRIFTWFLTVLFLVLGLMHLLRLIFEIGVVIGGWVVPAWVSGFGVVIPWLIALGIIRFGCCHKKK